MRKWNWFGTLFLLPLLLLAACATATAEELRLANETAEIEVYRSPT